MSKWIKEVIPDDAILYCRVHKNFISSKTGKPKESAFHNTPKTGDNLSSDWNKYTTPKESRALIGRQYRFGKTEFKDPNVFFIIQLETEKISAKIIGQTIEHDPVFNEPELDGIPNNRAHSIIIGDKNDPEIRLKFVEICEWAIAPE